MFADAVEMSANDSSPSIEVDATFLTDAKDKVAVLYKTL